MASIATISPRLIRLLPLDTVTNSDAGEVFSVDPSDGRLLKNDLPNVRSIKVMVLFKLRLGWEAFCPHDFHGGESAAFVVKEAK